MGEKITLTELGELISGMRKYINRPKNSGKAGNFIIIIKEINKALDKYEHDNKTTGNRRIQIHNSR